MKTILIKIKANWKALLVAILAFLSILFAADTGGTKLVKCITDCFQ